MNIDKAKKRISKKVKMGFQGYPELSIKYFGTEDGIANQVCISLVVEERATAMEESFKSSFDVREDEVIQTSIVKIIERSGAKTVILVAGVKVLA